MKVAEVGALGSPLLIWLMVSACVRKATLKKLILHSPGEDKASVVLCNQG